MTVQMSYAGGAPQLALTGNIGAADSSFVASTGGTASGYPDGSLGDFVVLIGNGEKVLCSARSGTTFTVALGGRGYDGTSAAAWSAGAVVEHVWDATSAQEASDHINITTRHDHTQYARVGFANTFSAKQDVQMPTGGVALRLGRTDTANPNSLNVTPYGAAAVAYASGAEFDGTTSTARAASASQFEQLNAGFNWYTDTSLTPGTPYGRTKVLSIVGKSLQVGDGAGLSTSATTGFLGLRYMAGTPTGVPDLGLGSVVYDNVTNKLWIYNGSWRSVAVT